MVQRDNTLSGNDFSTDLLNNPNIEEFEFETPHVNQYMNDFYVFDRSFMYHTLISEDSECRQNLDNEQYKALLASTQQQNQVCMSTLDYWKYKALLASTQQHNQVCTSTLDDWSFMNDSTNQKGCLPGAQSSGDNLSAFSEVGTNSPQNSGIGCSKEEKGVSGSGPSTPSFVSPSPGSVPSTPSSVNQSSNVAISCHGSCDQVSNTNNSNLNIGSLSLFREYPPQNSDVRYHPDKKKGKLTTNNEQKHDYSIEHYSSNDIQPLPSECNGDEALSSESKGTQSELPVEVNDKKHEVNCQLIKIGMEFSSEEEAYMCYSNYAAEMGFRVRKGKVQRLQDKTIKKRYFFCSKEGRRLEKQSDNTTKYKRKETRTGCKAMILLKVENGKWMVSNVILEHNHDLKNPSQTDMVDSLTEISETHSIRTINEVGIAKEAGAAKCAGLPTSQGDNSTPATRGGQSPARKRARGTQQVQAPIPLGVVPLPEEEEDSIPLSSLWKHRIPTFNVLTTSGDTRVSVEEEASSVDSGYQTPVPEKDTTHVGGQDTTSPLLMIEGPPHEGVQPETLVQDTIEPQQILQTSNPASSSTSREQEDDQSIPLPPEQTPLSKAPFVITETSGSVQRFSDFASLSTNMKELTRGIVSMIVERLQPPPSSTLVSGLPAIPTLADITAAVEVLRACLDKSATEIFSSPENVASFKQAISLLSSHHDCLSSKVALRNFLTRLLDFEKKIPLFVQNKERAASTRDDSSLKASELLKTLSQQQTCITGLQDSLDELSQRYEAVSDQIRKLEEERTQIQASISSTTAKLSENQQAASKGCQLLDASKQKVLLSSQDLAAAEDGLALFEFEWNTLKRRLFPPSN